VPALPPPPHGQTPRRLHHPTRTHGTDWTTPRGHRYTVTHPDATMPTIFEAQFVARITGHTTPGKLRF
jgi:hypothetical protein